MSKTISAARLAQEVEKDFSQQGKEYLEDIASSFFQIEGDILELTAEESTKLKLEKLARQVHAIKGSALGYGYDLISSICHQFEDRIVALTLDSKDIEPQIDLLLRHVDFLRGAVLAYRNHDNETIARLRSRLRRNSPAGSTSQEAQSGSARNLRVLLIEKMGALLLIMNQALKIYDSEGIEIAVARDGYEGFGRLLKEKFDCVVMSNRSECLKGTELLKLMASVDSPNAKTPFILLTSDASLDLPENQGPVYIVPKGDDLRQILHKHLKTIFGEPRKRIQSKETSYKNILVVDDSIVMHRLVEMALKRVPDISLRFAISGENALFEVEMSPPDLILLDFQMPGMDGVEFATRLREKHPGVPFVFLTAADSAEDHKKLRTVDPLSIFKKPFPPRDLPLWLAALPKAS